MTELKRLLREYTSDVLNKDKLRDLQDYCDEYFVNVNLSLDRGHIAVAKMFNIYVTGDEFNHQLRANGRVISF